MIPGSDPLRPPVVPPMDIREVHRDFLFSAIVIDPAVAGTEWIFFDYARGQPAAGSNKLATRYHTNLMRPGYSGLPQGHEFQAEAITIVSEGISEQLWAMLNRSSFRFEYNQRPFKTCRPADLFNRWAPIEVHLREGLGYRATLNAESMLELQALYESLGAKSLHYDPSSVRETFADLAREFREEAFGQTIRQRVRQIWEGPSAEHRLARMVENAYRRIPLVETPPRTITLWCILHGGEFSTSLRG